MRFLENALQIPEPDIVQKAGIIQFFEMSFELAWNMVKDYLEEQGFIDIKSPRGTLKKAFEIGIKLSTTSFSIMTGRVDLISWRSVLSFLRNQFLLSAYLFLTK